MPYIGLAPATKSGGQVLQVGRVRVGFPSKPSDIRCLHTQKKKSAVPGAGCHKAQQAGRGSCKRTVRTQVTRCQDAAVVCLQANSARTRPADRRYMNGWSQDARACGPVSWSSFRQLTPTGFTLVPSTRPSHEATGRLRLVRIKTTTKMQAGPPLARGVAGP